MKYSMSVELQNKLHDTVSSIAACLLPIARLHQLTCYYVSIETSMRVCVCVCVHSNKVRCTYTVQVHPRVEINNSFINWFPIKTYHCLATTHHNTIVRIARTIDLNAKTLKTCSRRAHRSNCILKNKWRWRRCTLWRCCALRSTFRHRQIYTYSNYVQCMQHHTIRGI